MTPLLGLPRLQLISTSAYYTYLLLLLKSALHGALVVFCLLRGSEVGCARKSAGQMEAEQHLQGFGFSAASAERLSGF